MSTVEHVTTADEKPSPNSVRAIAAALTDMGTPASPATVHRDLVKAGPRQPARVLGLDGKTYPNSKTAHELAITAALTGLAAGHNLQDVAAHSNVSPRTVRRWRQHYRLVEPKEST